MSLHLNATPPPATTSSSAPLITIQATGQVKINKKVLHVSAVRGTTGKLQTIQITNSGSGNLTLGNDAFSFTGTDAAQFSVVNASLPTTIRPGRKATFFVALTPAGNAPVNRVLTATLNVKPSGETNPTGSVAVRGLATVGEGEDREPSLSRILELFNYTINTGDATPDTTYLDIPNGATTDQITAPRFEKARNGYVTVTPIAQYVPDAETAAGTFGFYEPGSPDTRKTLFTLDGDDAQSISPDSNGSTSWDPGNRAFSVWAEAPKFIDGLSPRVIYGEEALNTWEPNYVNRNKVRVYPLQENGATVENAYVVAFEEYPPANDQNDYVFVIRNVRPLRSTPEVGLISLNGELDSSRLTFNRIQNENTTLGNDVADVRTVRIVNSGNRDLVIDSISLTSGSSQDFAILNAPSGDLTLRRNATFDLNVQFIAQSGGRRAGQISIVSNDRDEPTKVVTLGGFWQSDSESNGQGVSQEPTLQEIFETFGIRTAALFDGEEMDGNGAVDAVGDEVLSNAWAVADESKPVSLEQIAGFHSQGSVNGVGWYRTGTTDFNVLYYTNGVDGQSFFPRKLNSNDRAGGTFSPDGNFGFRIDNEYSEADRNVLQPGDVDGHHFRFYPLRDPRGEFVRDAYVMTMDFSSINFDYNDNVFILRNIRPADQTSAVFGLTGAGSSAGNALEWADIEGAKGYEVYRSDKAAGTYVKITDELLTSSDFLDTGAARDRTRYYRIVAISDDDRASVPANVGVYRPAR
jgi:hypothetical protein